jgi:hypothetical protein
MDIVDWIVKQPELGRYVPLSLPPALTRGY